MSKRSVENLLLDILESIQKITSYTNNLAFADFTSSSIVIDAVIRNIEIIGEAANRLPDTFKENNPHIDWHKIRGLRNRIVHDYFGIDHEIIWSVIEIFLPQLSAEINLMVGNL